MATSIEPVFTHEWQIELAHAAFDMSLRDMPIMRTSLLTELMLVL